MMRTPPSQASSRAASRSIAARPSTPDVLEQLQLDRPVPALAPAADDPALPPHRRPGVAARVEQLLLVAAEVPLAVGPAHRRRVERRQQRRPRLDRGDGIEVVRQQVAGLPVELDRDGAERGQRAADEAERGAEPPLEVALGPRPERAQPAAPRACARPRPPSPAAPAARRASPPSPPSAGASSSRRRRSSRARPSPPPTATSARAVRPAPGRPTTCRCRTRSRPRAAGSPPAGRPSSPRGRRSAPPAPPRRRRRARPRRRRAARRLRRRGSGACARPRRRGRSPRPGPPRAAVAGTRTACAASTGA